MKTDENSELSRLTIVAKKMVGDSYGWKSRFAKLLSMTPQQLNSILKKKAPIGPAIREKLIAIGCDTEYIKTGNKKEDISNNLVTIPLMKIPVFTYVKAGGRAMVLKDDPSGYIYTQKSSDTSLFAVVVKGDSMFPEIREGNKVVVSKMAEPHNGDICIITFNDDETCLRKVYFHDHTVTLVSLNEKDFPAQDYKKSEIKHIYRVVQQIITY